MTKYCPKCGSEMSDNAQFCMGCGAKLSDYSFKEGHKMSDNVINRSQVGQASVGNVNISPRMNQTSYQNACTTCGRGAAAQCWACKSYVCGTHSIKMYNQTWKPGVTVYCPHCYETQKKDGTRIN